ncbi:MAG: hypothetical protein OEW20_13050 [Nitrospira sp.]|nr:hypothetical protein [Nitrospira sp.]
MIRRLHTQGQQTRGAHQMANGTILSRVGWFSMMIVVGGLLASCDSTVRQIGKSSTESSPVVQTESREKHTDRTYGFTVKYYPKEYVLLTDGPIQTATQPPAVQRVRFQRKDIAAGQVAGYEPPGLTVSVFERSPERLLHEWLDSAGLLPPGSEISPVRLTGVKEGLRVTLRQQPAPNEFVYFATDQYIYSLVPYGTKGGKILRSFRLLPDSSRAHMRH